MNRHRDLGQCERHWFIDGKSNFLLRLFFSCYQHFFGKSTAQPIIYNTSFIQGDALVNAIQATEQTNIKKNQILRSESASDKYACKWPCLLPISPNWCSILSTGCRQHNAQIRSVNFIITAHTTKRETTNFRTIQFNNSECGAPTFVRENFFQQNTRVCVHVRVSCEWTPSGMKMSRTELATVCGWDGNDKKRKERSNIVWRTGQFDAETGTQCMHAAETIPTMAE